eukprot:TRINITY_DN12625_c0_g1_i3.p1 TRINITY_DN12625_c0_g1~~TRINITY_DN12625_c0_g1_i3.p1  ORF type:complete len:121 (+),score=41.47 TRINITY_DN12625_c0_g1_i3:30-365(+)
MSVEFEAPAAVEQQVQGFIRKDLSAVNAVTAGPVSQHDMDGPLGRQMQLFADGVVTYTYVEESCTDGPDCVCLVHVKQEGGLGMEDWVMCRKRGGMWKVEQWGVEVPGEAQ